MILDTTIVVDDPIKEEEEEIIEAPMQTPKITLGEPMEEGPSAPAAVIPNISLATPEPTAAPTELPPVQLTLPSPSYEFDGKGQAQPNFIQSEGYNADAWLYDVGDPDSVVSAYLQRCQQAGFSWTLGDYLGLQNVYAIYHGDQTAFLALHYGTQALLIVPKGMEKEEERPDPEAYEENKLLLTVNGKKIQMDFKPRWYFYDNMLTSSAPSTKILLETTLIFSSLSGAYDLVVFSLPKNMKVNTTYTAVKGNRNDLSFIMYDVSGANTSKTSAPGKGFGTPVVELKSFVNGEGGVSQTKVGSSTVLSTKFEPKLNSEKSLVSSSDYFSITPIFEGKNEFRGHFEGSFENGAYKVSGTFWAKK